MDKKQSGSETVKNEKDKNQKHALRNALIVIIVCGVAVIILLAVLLPRRGNSISDESDVSWLTATETIYDDSEVTGYVEYIYDDDGMLTNQIWYDGPDGTATGEQTVYTYDENGNLISMVDSYPDGSEFSTTYTYDEDDNLLSEVFSDPSDYIGFSYEYTYDEDGNQISMAYTSLNGYEYLYEYTYDEDGNLISETYTEEDEEDEDAEYEYRTEYTYDEDGNMTSEVALNPDGSSSYSTEYTYDKDGNLTLELRTNSDGTEHRIEYDYDKDGNMTSRDITYYDGSERKYEYTYESYDDVKKTSDHTRL